MLDIQVERYGRADISPLCNHRLWLKCQQFLFTLYLLNTVVITLPPAVRGIADKSLARPGRKQATSTKLGTCSKYSPRRSPHLLARCSNFCKPLKNNSEGCPSNQVSAAAMTSASDKKRRPFNCFCLFVCLFFFFFSPGSR